MHNSPSFVFCVQFKHASEHSTVAEQPLPETPVTASASAPTSLIRRVTLAGLPIDRIHNTIEVCGMSGLA